MSAGPLISDIARGSTVDGPGLRTVVFIKGCPLRCAWCHNPEAQVGHAELAYDVNRCGKCGACVAECKPGALELGDAGLVIDRKRCTRCGVCTAVCDRLALRMVGQRWTRDELLELILRDEPYYRSSGGGVTFSGGEALLYMQWLSPLVRDLHERGIHVAFETCGYFELADFDRLIGPWVDLLLFDVKLIDPQRHLELTGARNEGVLANLEALIRRGSLRVLPRVPLVPGLTATADNLDAIADHLRGLGVEECELLTYNPSGSAKWARLGRAASSTTMPLEQLPERPLPWPEERALRERFMARLRGEPGSLDAETLVEGTLGP